MNKTTLLTVFASLLLAACGGSDNAAVPEPEAKQPWAEFAATTIDEYYRRNPESAVDAGLHQYDGQMTDISLEAQAEYASWIDGVLVEAASYSDLEGTEAFERDYLSTAFNGELFWMRDTNFRTKNPLSYTGLSFSVYVDREYAPLEQRIQAYTKYMQQAPRISRL